MARSIKKGPFVEPKLLIKVEKMEVSGRKQPITSELGILHPQEGVLNGHYQPGDFAKARKIKQLQNGVSLSVNAERLTPSKVGTFKVVDLITGYGTAMSVEHFYAIWGGDLTQKRASKSPSSMASANS